MAQYTQENRTLAIETPLGKDALLLAGFSGAEEMSRLFSFELELLSEKGSIACKDIVGKNVTFVITLLDESPRHFNGFVRRFSYRGKDDRLHRYNAEVVPWLWFLTRTTDCRIFQNKTVVQIIEQIFGDLGFTDFQIGDIKGSHLPREYCVQYRESDFDFVSRLLEEEGIFYYFRHENGKHTLVMADGKAAYKDCPESQVEFKASLNAPQWGDLITGWEHQYEYRSGKYAQTDYNFQTPTAPMLAGTPTVVKLDNVTKFELYDFPGKHEKKADGDAVAKIRMEQEEVPHDVVYGSSKCRSFFTGGRFTLTAHQDPAEENKSYLITSIHHSVAAGQGYESGGDGSAVEYSNSFTCIPDSLTFRPARLTKKPIVHGSQTAIVVGPKGEEIYTDKFGRVKVHFHWDRYDKADENSSCWIRVAQLWAGKQWGAMYIPRIGQEVIVDFLEGDPDRPIITGRVYHAESMPPYELPANATMSTIKTSSSKGGDGFNEIRFEDKKDSEHIFMHAQKEMHARVKKDSFEWIGENWHLIIVKDQFEQVDGDKHLTIAGDQNEKVKGTVSLDVGSDLQQKVGSNHGLEAGSEIHLKGGSNVIIEAGMMLTLKAGSNAVVIDSSGVTVKGSLVTVDGSMVKIASGPGTSAGSGAGCSPDAAQPPKEAMDAEPGEVNEAPESEPQEPEAFSPAAVVLQQAAEDGTPFCEQCEKARQERLAQAQA